MRRGVAVPSVQVSVTTATPGIPGHRQGTSVKRSEGTVIAAVIAALGLIVEGTVVAVGGAIPDDNWGARGSVVNAAFIIAAIALIVAAQALPSLLGLRRGGRAGVVATQIGFAAMAVESVRSQIHGGNTWGPLFFGGLLLALLGSTAVAIDGLLVGRLRWAAALPLLGILVGIAGGNHGGSIVWGGLWLVLAAVVARVELPTSRAVTA
jgi:hypothetical protein